jgi:hypothetical protein
MFGWCSRPENGKERTLPIIFHCFCLWCVRAPASVHILIGRSIIRNIIIFTQRDRLLFGLTTTTTTTTTMYEPQCPPYQTEIHDQVEFSRCCHVGSPAHTTAFTARHKHKNTCSTAMAFIGNDITHSDFMSRLQCLRCLWIERSPLCTSRGMIVVVRTYKIPKALREPNEYLKVMKEVLESVMAGIVFLSNIDGWFSHVPGVVPVGEPKDEESQQMSRISFHFNSEWLLDKMCALRHVPMYMTNTLPSRALRCRLEETAVFLLWISEKFANEHSRFLDYVLRHSVSSPVSPIPNSNGMFVTAIVDAVFYKAGSQDKRVVWFLSTRIYDLSGSCKPEDKGCEWIQHYIDGKYIRTKHVYPALVNTGLVEEAVSALNTSETTFVASGLLQLAGVVM